MRSLAEIEYVSETKINEKEKFHSKSAATQKG